MKNWLVINKEKVALFAVTIFLVIFCFVHLRLVSNTFYVDSSSSFHSTTEGYGDVPLHLTQISKFAFSSSFDTSDPIYFGMGMNYHFVLNLIRGLILAVTGSWSIAVLWPLYVFVIVNIFLVFYIYRSLLKNSYLAILGFLIFFLGPSIAWYDAVVTKQAFFLTKFDAVYPFQNVDFGAPLILCLIHQHTFIFGLTLFLVFIYGLIHVEKNKNPWIVLVPMIALGILPLSHVHSFISASVVLLVLSLLNIFERNYEQVKKLLVVGLGALALVIPQLVYLWGSSGEHFVKFRWGWMLGEGIGAINFPGEERSIFSLPFLDFIWTNFGIILPLFIT
jgi:hypothetical protein